MISDMMRSDEFGISFLYRRILGRLFHCIALHSFADLSLACNNTRRGVLGCARAGRKPDEDGKRHYAELALQPVEAGEEAEVEARTVAQGLSAAQVADELLQSQEFIERATTAAKAAGLDASSGQPLMWAQAADFCDELSHFAATTADLRYLHNKLLGHAPDSLAIKTHSERPLNVLSLVAEILHSDEYLNSLADPTGPGAARAQSAGYLALVRARSYHKNPALPRLDRHFLVCGITSNFAVMHSLV
jgi:hypothetical protein